MESQTSIITQTKADGFQSASIATPTASTQSVADKEPQTVKKDDATTVKFPTTSPLTSAIIDKSQTDIPITLSTNTIPTTSNSTVPTQCGVGCAIIISVSLFAVICILVLFLFFIFLYFRKKDQVRSLSVV